MKRLLLIMELLNIIYITNTCTSLFFKDSHAVLFFLMQGTDSKEEDDAKIITLALTLNSHSRNYLRQADFWCFMRYIRGDMREYTIQSKRSPFRITNRK